MYQYLTKDNLAEMFPNIEIALRIFLTLMVTNCSGERSFSKLKFIKNELRSTTYHGRLSSLALLNIEYDVLKEICFDDVIDDFVKNEVRRKVVAKV